MITPSFSLTATERVLPRLALNFTTGVLDPRVTITRALNTATRVNSSGLIEIVNADLPRFDYNPATLAARGLLIEESRANLLTQSQGYNTANWTKGAGASVVQNAIGPDGAANTAATLSAVAGTGAHWTFQLFAASAVPYTQSVYAKAGTASWLGVSFGGGADADGVFFNLANGTVGTAAFGSTGTIQNAGNGWYRCIVTRTLAASNYFGALQVNTANGQALGWNATGSENILIFGSQVEVGAFATSYIPTTTASLTRNADVASITGSNFSSWWQATTGALSVSARQLAITGTRPWAYINDGTANNIIALRGNVANPELYIKATTDQAQIDAGTLAANTSYGLAGSWNTNNCAAAINGGAAVMDMSATIPTVDRMLIGSDGTNYISGWIEKMSFWPQRITDAEVQAFSK